ncbi:MAG: helix-turn-helix domain-containing protein [Pseudonocardia sp.]|jgi:excisionase family DNA binding protein
MLVAGAAVPGELSFYTPLETAEIFRCSRMTVYRAIAADEVPAIRWRGQWRVPKRWVDEQIKKTVEAGSPVLAFLDKEEK